MLGIVFMFVAVAILSCLDITGWKVTYFAVNLVCAAFISVFAAIYQVVSVSLASSLPNRYMEAVFSGQEWCIFKLRLYFLRLNLLNWACTLDLDRQNSHKYSDCLKMSSIVMKIELL